MQGERVCYREDRQELAGQSLGAPRGLGKKNCQASLCFFYSCSLPAPSGITLCSQLLWQLDNVPCQHPAHKQEQQTAVTETNARSVEHIIRVKAKEHWAVGCVPLAPQAALHQRQPQKHVSPLLLSFPCPSSTLAFALSKTTPLLPTFFMNSARNQISSTSPGVKVNFQRQKLFALSRSFLPGRAIPKVLGVNEATFHFALFQLWLC